MVRTDGKRRAQQSCDPATGVIHFAFRIIALPQNTEPQATGQRPAPLHREERTAFRHDERGV
jgi:hypothetical protein